MKTLTMILCCLLCAMAHAASPRSSYGKVDNAALWVSPISLIAAPSKYDGKAVRVIGAFSMAFEGQELCVHKEDLLQGLEKNCLWIEPNLNVLGASRNTLSELNGKYVLVEGTFEQDNHGHFGLFSGAITGIWRVMLWRR